MDSHQRSAAELNKEGGKLFKARDFRGAVKKNELATAAADRASIHFSNLAAAYLKLGKYLGAHEAANKALLLEPRTLKARYRRAMARKQLTLIPEALVDITSPLTSDPDNIDAKAEFRTLVDMQNKTGIQRRFTPEDLLEGTSPSAHGSLLLNPVRMDRDDPHHMKLPFFKTATFPPSTTHVANIHGACHACRTPKHRKDLKTCKKCFRVNYFSVECQRAEWPEHKLTCKPARDDNLTIRVGRRLADHPYFKTLLLLYALRAMGPARLPEEDHDLILMVVVDMLPLLGSAHPGRQHIVVKNILAVPTCIVPEEVAYVQRAALDDGPRGLRVHCVWIATTGIYPDGEESRFRLILLPAADIMVSSAHLPNFSLDLYSHSHGVFRRVSLDVDFIFESLNDELRLDIDNYYQLQG